MKKVALMLAISFSITGMSNAQADGGFIAAASEYAGDLAKNPFVLSETKPGGEAFFRYYVGDQFSVVLTGSVGRISGDDANKETSDNRNLSFRSLILSASVTGNYHFGDIEVDNIVPYVKAGVGLFKHNPQAERNGTWIALQPLGTEGQGIPGFGDKYDLVQFDIPFGAGVQMRLTDRFIFNGDIAAHKTFTDHLDDVSRREYVAPSILIQNGADAVDLAYRADEIGGRPYIAFEDPNIRARDPRNLSQKKDWFYLIGFGVSYYMPNLGNKDRNPIKRNRKRVPYRL